ncbi:MAG TPA: uroporphyrinogen decarboxylase family protein [Candidatus Hydrogenedentes bacterium]|nr:uroporphyrinogen decarboxylase family protein [Candidatus Hydrogenedentota bacterium]HPC14869.1 uroporphyrinogen decarboxylase family protein [Candidatus Hydrogenedentota bacterium]HRT18733.1 uroporphyrinogen decarboxylase family protein [Candidatus Hydrogenedentota bacterium]HRT63753.1 uroporphyrinogen decarboxylase family protein [Candidatus Hydrogenedentota bacterium]
MITDLERFIACMEYRPCDRRPNHELGVWPQTVDRWRAEAPDAIADFRWDWFVDEPAIGLDRREYINVNYGLIPHFEPVVIEETDKYITARNHIGVVTKALKEGSVGGGRMCMDQYLEFPVQEPKDFVDIKRRLIAAIPERYPADLDDQIARWRTRDFPLVLGRNCAANGFYWRAREFMGTEALSTAFYEYPDLMHEMMEFYADLIIETSRPVLEKIQVEYFVLNEDFAMKSGPLIGPNIFREFIFPHLKRMVEFFRAHGTRYFAVDSDGDPTVLIPHLMDAGVDTLWPIERASNVSPMQWRRQFGKSLRLWGGVDKRELAKGPEAIRAHLREFIPLIEEGGFIPTVDHTVPPDVSWDNFRYYMDAKTLLLSGKL